MTNISCKTNARPALHRRSASALARGPRAQYEPPLCFLFHFGTAAVVINSALDQASAALLIIIIIIIVVDGRGVIETRNWWSIPPSSIRNRRRPGIGHGQTWKNRIFTAAVFPFLLSPPPPPSNGRRARRKRFIADRRRVTTVTCPVLLFSDY